MGAESSATNRNSKVVRGTIDVISLHDPRNTAHGVDGLLCHLARAEGAVCLPAINMTSISACQRQTHTSVASLLVGENLQ
jgi:hypothetical protein